MQIHSGMAVRLSETVDVELGAVKGAKGVVVDYNLAANGPESDEIAVMFIDAEDVCSICTVTRSMSAVICHEMGGLLWKKSFPLKRV